MSLVNNYLSSAAKIIKCRGKLTKQNVFGDHYVSCCDSHQESEIEPVLITIIVHQST